MPTATRSRTDEALNAAHEAVRASIEAASRVAHVSLEAGTDAARSVQDSLKKALNALADGERESSRRTPASKSSASSKS